MIAVDREQCDKIGQIVGSLQIRPEFYNREFIRLDADRETKLRIYFLSVAICHQTHNLKNVEKNLYGWDFLEYGFLELFKSKSALLNPGYLAICDPELIKNTLLTTFSPDGDPEKSTLDKIDERCNMILEICDFLNTRYGSSVSKFIDHAGGYLLNQDHGLYEVLPQINSYSDPLQKKSSFFIKLAMDAGLIFIRDPENLIPVMDYHMQRVLLRMGCVEVTDEDLGNKLRKQELMESDHFVRKACVEAIRYISEVSGRNVLSMNDFFWPLGRSCCYDTTLCTSGICRKNPCSFDRIVQLESHQDCVFRSACHGAESEEYRELWEPRVITSFY